MKGEEFMDRDFERLVDRLNELERENRRWRRAGLVVLIGLAALLVMGQARTPRVVEADEVTAHKFTVRDEQGNSRAVLGTSGGKITLSLADSTDQSGAVVVGGGKG